MKYIVSDLHGEYELFLELLDQIGFSESDEMIVCGDIIDKGVHSVKLAKFIFSMSNIRSIAGNHEYAFLKHYWAIMQRESYNFDGVLKKLQSYFPDDGYLLDWETVDAFESLPYYIEEDEFICAHAGVHLDGQKRIKPLKEATLQQLVYDRTFKEPSVLPSEGKCVFFGHTPTGYLSNEYKILTYPRKNDPQSISDYYKIHLDTGVFLSGILGCFCVDTCRSFYVKN